MISGTRTRTAPQNKAERRPPGPHGLGTAGGPVPAILGLQRTAGNRAVSRWLARGERELMEARFGDDFSGVRVHEDSSLSAAAGALHARAYTVGEDIVIGPHAAPPGSLEGRRTLAHELAHVVQQRRGGRSLSLDDSGQLEQAADRAAAQVVEGRGMVDVHGAAGPGVMCQRDDESEAAARRREKQRTQQRKRERETAGREERDLAREKAERELRALEASYRKPGAKQRSVKRKATDLERFRRLLKPAGGTPRDKNVRQGAFDELQRTPTTTAGKPQTKHVAGGEQLPGQELRPGKDSYAQPDYSILRRRQDGSIERLHVNLKSHPLDARTPAQARAIARDAVEQAIRNSRHLKSGEAIVISYARTPSPEVQEQMKRELFRHGSPVGEVRFGTTTYRRKDYTPPVPAPKQTTAKAAKPVGPKRKPTAKRRRAPKGPSSQAAEPATGSSAAPAALPANPRATTPATKLRAGTVYERHSALTTEEGRTRVQIGTNPTVSHSSRPRPAAGAGGTAGGEPLRKPPSPPAATAATTPPAPRIAAAPRTPPASTTGRSVTPPSTAISTAESAAAILKETSPSTSRWARGARGAAKAGGILLKGLSAVGPLAETLGLVEQFETAKAQIDELSKRRDEVELAVLRALGWEPVYRNGVVVDYKPKPPADTERTDPATSRQAGQVSATGTEETAPAASKEPVPVYRLGRFVLKGERLPLSSNLVPITFRSLTDVGVVIFAVSETSADRTFTGYTTRGDYPRLIGLAAQQMRLLKLGKALQTPPTPTEPEAQPPAQRGQVWIDFEWREGNETKGIHASCDNTKTADGSWVASHEGSLERLRMVTEQAGDQPPQDYEISVLYIAADGSQSHLQVVHSTAHTSEDGYLPPDALEPGRYPEGSAVGYIVDNYL